ncbi:MAG TPA: hypothetical protein VKA44_06015, partial [Gemmatimonadota bacterium]|nr:hypothetical protein [Gemmatimonadota bacterium]
DGAWKRYEAARSRLARGLDSAEAAGDTAGAMRDRIDLRAVRAFGLWKRGRLAPAIAAMDSVRASGRRGQPPMIWLGLMHEQAGELQEGARYLLSLQTWHPVPLVSYFLGRIYARMGKTEEARRQLDLFVRAWSGGDPEVQPLVADARKILDGLGPGAEAGGEGAEAEAGAPGGDAQD